jgi:hypothetical protein
MIDNGFFGFGMNNGTARLRMTTDGGSQWFNQTLNISGSYTSAVAFHDNKLFGVAASSISLPAIARTTDGGTTWLPVVVGSGPVGVCKLKWVSGSSVVYLMGENGQIMRSLDNGLVWTTMQTANVPNLYHFDFIKINGIIYGYAVSTNGSVIRLIDSLLFITGTGKTNSEVPSDYSLSQNYPNPFNPVTVIGFDLPAASFTRIVIYNVLGREVESLVSERLNAGHHELTWNASGFASGIYYYTIYAEGFSDTKKMVLTK